MNAYTRKHRNGNYSTRFEIPGLIEPMCWKNGKRLKCPPKSKARVVTPNVKKTKSKTKRRKSKSVCLKNGKRVKCSTRVPPRVR